MIESSQITQFLNQGQLDEQAWEQILPIVYQQLKHLARQVKSDHRATPTLNTTALVHDVYLKIRKYGDLNLQGKQHFYRLAAQAMRQILIDAARAKKTGKRDGVGLAWDENMVISIVGDAAVSADELLAIDDALEHLQQVNPKLVEVVELHFFTGYGFAQIAELLGTSESSVFRLWKKARAMLYAQLH